MGFFCGMIWGVLLRGRQGLWGIVFLWCNSTNNNSTPTNPHWLFFFKGQCTIFAEKIMPMPPIILYCKPRQSPHLVNESRQLRVFWAHNTEGSFHQIAWSNNFTIVAMDHDVAPKLHPGVLCNFISAEDILNIEFQEENQQARINLTDKRSLLSPNSLESFERWLQAGPFIRVHQKYLVNQDHIFSFENISNTLVLSDQSEVPCDYRIVSRIVHYISSHKDHMHVTGNENIINPKL